MNQSFEEATEIRSTFFFSEAFESVIGLPRLEINDEDSSLRAASVFHKTTKVIDKGSVELLGPYGLEKGLINLSRNIVSLDTGVITHDSARPFGS